MTVVDYEKREHNFHEVGSMLKDLDHERNKQVIVTRILESFEPGQDPGVWVEVLSHGEPVEDAVMREMTTLRLTPDEARLLAEELLRLADIEEDLR
jgi:hypothetical protein